MVEEKTKEVKKEIKTVVVKELPTQSMNRVADEKGDEFNLLTTEEALTLVLEKISKIEKSVA